MGLTVSLLNLASPGGRPGVTAPSDAVPETQDDSAYLQWARIPPGPLTQPHGLSSGRRNSTSQSKYVECQKITLMGTAF